MFASTLLRKFGGGGNPQHIIYYSIGASSSGTRQHGCDFLWGNDTVTTLIARAKSAYDANIT